MGVYADAAGPVGRGLDTGIGLIVGWGRLLVPAALVATGMVLVRGDARDRRGRRRSTPRPAPTSGSAG